jgi:hypothetical protein
MALSSSTNLDDPSDGKSFLAIKTSLVADEVDHRSHVGASKGEETRRLGSHLGAHKRVSRSALTCSHIAMAHITRIASLEMRSRDCARHVRMGARLCKYHLDSQSNIKLYITVTIIASAIGPAGHTFIHSRQLSVYLDTHASTAEPCRQPPTSTRYFWVQCIPT